MYKIALGIFIGGGLPAILMLFLPRKKVYGCGEKLGVIASKLLRQKLGKPGENAMETTLVDFMNGLEAGLQKDNERKIEKLNHNIL